MVIAHGLAELSFRRRQLKVTGYLTGGCKDRSRKGSVSDGWDDERVEDGGS